MPVVAWYALFARYFLAAFGPGRTKQAVLFVLLVQLVLFVLFVLLAPIAVIGFPVCAARDALRSSFVLFTVIDIGFTFATRFTARLFRRAAPRPYYAILRGHNQKSDGHSEE